MMRPSRFRLRFLPLAALLVFIWPSALVADGTPRLRELRTQGVGGTVYFHVRFAAPADLRLAKVQQLPASEMQRRQLARLPQLVPQDGKATAVYPRVAVPDYRPAVGFEEVRPPVPVRGLEFVGKVVGGGKVKFLLLYPIRDVPPPFREVAGKDGTALTPTDQRGSWAEVPVEVDFAGALNVDVPDRGGRRKPAQAPTADDLEGLWAEAQAARLAVLEVLAPEFSFYGFACEATGRKYGVRAPALERDGGPRRDLVYRQLYETTTGSAAITESLQLHRMLHPEFRDNGPRTVDVWNVPGIDVAEHPWEQMIGAKKPAPEPLAGLVPRDNYYLHFKSVRKFIELGELLDQWGTNATRAYEMNSRDYDLKERYERQLCLRSSWLGKTLGPAVIRSLAVTGNDPYLREGSDLTVLVHVTNAKLFLAGVEKFLREARQEFGSRLKEGKADYQGVAVESFVTPLREVSLHRAVLGEFVIYSNSPTGLRRALDAHHGRLRSLAESLDFRYMRTVFRLDDEQEDGFLFLSDPFIRQLVGPASKIKEKRRLEALTSLTMVTNGAIFSAWETGKLPADQESLLAASALKPAEVYTPEGKGVTWDAGQEAAVSEAYNTLQFSTPLIELSIDKVTPTEEKEYLAFRSEYLNLWRKYFDPVGMRFSLSDKQVKVETYILPLVRNNDYDWLRQMAGGGTTNLDPRTISRRSLIQWVSHITPANRNEGLGDWLMVRLDDGPEVRKFVDYCLRKQLEPGKPNGVEWEQALEYLQVVLQLPWTAGVGIADEKKFAESLSQLQRAADAFGPCEREILKPAYKGVAITRVRFAANSQVANFLQAKGALPALYHARIGDGWYVSLREAPLKELIDRAAARRAGDGSATKGEAVAVNESLYFSPAAARKAGEALRFYLEWESHRRALVNGPTWYPLYRGGLVAAGASEATKRVAAFRYYGFVPVSPDGAAYCYDARTGEVVNGRHGSLRQPRLHGGIEADSPLAQLLEQFRTFRADLRFREDGLYTVLTVERKAPAR
jgi:hypothetical protein